MPETAESHSTLLTTNRNCILELTNVSSVYCLYMPKVHLENGFVYSPPTPTLNTNLTEVCSFTKDDHTASGASGVLTYELFNMRSRRSDGLLAVMFSVPFDYNLYSNWYGVGIFERSTECDDKLFDLMYNKKDDSFVRHKADGSGIKICRKKLEARACMSDEGRAIIKMELYDEM
ncbi:uncharacterized protein [Antennarius striatus]|uniref:uncharacterized protein n=1 Tax=Antennarius striatus TaxID=241820 RepID=UPI0035B4BEC5